MVDPYELLDGIDARIEGMQRQALTMRDEMAAVSVTERSRDGQITVTINHMGNLTGLEIGPSARAESSLPQDILRTVQAAQSRLADAMRAGVPSAHANPETMSAIVSQVSEMFPEPMPDDYVKGGHVDLRAEASRFVPDGESAAEPPPRPAARPGRVKSDPANDDDYYTDGDFFR